MCVTAGGGGKVRGSDHCKKEEQNVKISKSHNVVEFFLSLSLSFCVCVVCACACVRVCISLPWQSGYLQMYKV